MKMYQVLKERGGGLPDLNEIVSNLGKMGRGGAGGGHNCCKLNENVLSLEKMGQWGGRKRLP